MRTLRSFRPKRALATKAVHSDRKRVAAGAIAFAVATGASIGAYAVVHSPTSERVTTAQPLTPSAASRAAVNSEALAPGATTAQTAPPRNPAIPGSGPQKPSTNNVQPDGRAFTSGVSAITDKLGAMKLRVSVDNVPLSVSNIAVGVFAQIQRDAAQNGQAMSAGVVASAKDVDSGVAGAILDQVLFTDAVSQGQAVSISDTRAKIADMMKDPSAFSGLDPGVRPDSPTFIASYQRELTILQRQAAVSSGSILVAASAPGLPFRSYLRDGLMHHAVTISGQTDLANASGDSIASALPSS